MKLHIYFDYTCPFCYIGIKQLRAVLQSYSEFEPIWHPFELRPKPTDREDVVVDPESGSPWEAALLEEAEKEELTLNTPHSPYPYTTLAFQGMYFTASQKRNVEAYNEKVFQAVFLEGKDIGDITVLTDIAKSLGMDGSAFEKALKEELFRDRQEKALKHAYFEAGIEEVPTYIAAKLRVSGAIGREAMAEFLEECKEERERIKSSKTEQNLT